MACYYETTASAGDTVWVEWCDSGTATSSTSGAWAYWCGCSGSATSTWTAWNTSDAHIARAIQRHYSPPPTKEELEAANRRAEETERKLAEEKAKREAAEKRAEELLLANLAKEQREQFKKEKKFRVMGGDGASFEIAYGRAGNITELDKDGKRIARFCIHPKEDVPNPDTMLAQKLMLETDPATFRKIANRTPLPVS